MNYRSVVVLGKATARAAGLLGLNGAALAKVLGASEATVSRVLRGERPLAPHTKGGELAALLVRLRGYEGVREAVARAPPPPSAPVLPMHFRKGNTSLKLFTTIATLGTPQDITSQELRIESFFPSDIETAEILRGWAIDQRSAKT